MAHSEARRLATERRAARRAEHEAAALEAAVAALEGRAGVRLDVVDAVPPGRRRERHAHRRTCEQSGPPAVLLAKIGLMAGPLRRNSTPPADILLVDDEPAVLVVHEALLASQGHRIVTAASADEALARVAESAPDLIISDLMMRQLDGVELARELRSRPETRDIPVVLMSVLDDRETRVRACEVADAFLNKPVDGLELLLRVRLLLKQRMRVRELLEENAHLRAENARLSRQR